MMQPQVIARRQAREHCPGAGNRVPFGRMEDVKRIGGKEATAAMADLLGHRHLLIPAGVPWFA